MFKKDKRSDNGKELASEEIVDRKTLTSAPNGEKKDEKTIIGEYISIEGNIRGEGDLLFEGSMKGNIEMEKHNFALGSKGRFEGEIQARNVSISGQMAGNIKKTRGGIILILILAPCSSARCLRLDRMVSANTRSALATLVPKRSVWMSTAAKDFRSSISLRCPRFRRASLLSFPAFTSRLYKLNSSLRAGCTCLSSLPILTSD